VISKLFRVQIDLYTRPVVPIALTGVDLQKAVALLQALLAEAVTKPAAQLSDAVKKETVDE
jgi:hypothetical protein